MKDNKNVDQFFKNNKQANEAFVTEDGFVFATKNYAKLHAETNPKSVKSRKPLKITKVSRVENIDVVIDSKKGSKKQNAEERIEAINAMSIVEDVVQALADEKAKTVIAAGEAKIQELNNKA